MSIDQKHNLSTINPGFRNVYEIDILANVVKKFTNQLALMSLKIH